MLAPSVSFNGSIRTFLFVAFHLTYVAFVILCVSLNSTVRNDLHMYMYVLVMRWDDYISPSIILWNFVGFVHQQLVAKLLGISYLRVLNVCVQ